MTSNFDFLLPHFSQLHPHATQAERLTHTAPRASCFYARFTLEQLVHWLYANDPYLKLPYDTNLGALIHEPTFKDNLKPGLFPKIRILHTTGNSAVHDPRPISDRDSLRLIEDLFHVTYWLVRFYSPNGRDLPNLSFDPAKIPSPQPQPDLSQQQLQALAQELAQTQELQRLTAAKHQQTEAELIAAKAERDALLAQNAVSADRHDYNETDTRRYLIDTRLREAGWDPSEPHSTEVEVQGMPQTQPGASGRGFVDYVLWGDNGKPLALIEAKRTHKSPDSGQHQAKLYADCLEQRYQQRPVIFYSNGYDTWIWDDLAYPPRPILGFLRKDELERLIFRRSNRKALGDIPINLAIAGQQRSYQQKAIRHITETFERDRARRALLVMATGTGKTRTALALVDLMKRANWVQRVLFLADRTALLTQAYRAIQSHLPTVTPLNLTYTKEAAALTGANVIFSTYSTMVNALDPSRGDQRWGSRFGVGYFDLVIVDEAHRSIYKKYGQLFNYFDALLVGLTATPRAEVDRDTYRIFELQQGVPTFAYELEDAVQDGHLVPARGLKVPFKFLRTGIRYADLSPAEQQDYEEKFRDEDTGELPATINAAALNNWLFNISTVDQALELLMQRGLKVNSGDRLGKTIIFARNHNHAAFIRDRFNVNYPKYKGLFAQVIDSHDSYAQSLLDDFSDPQKDPIIAISVDMLDTGVDVPEVVNLVFFKPVFSRVKFNQMLGRGTRLCRGLFGPDQNKTEFLVFDLCGNFEYFSQNVPEIETKSRDSLTARLVKHRLELLRQLPGGLGSATTLDPAGATAADPTATTATTAQEVSGTYRVTPGLDPSEPTTALRTALRDSLHRHVATMHRANFMVRTVLPLVETFGDRSRWDRLTAADLDPIADSLAGLPNGLSPENPLTQEFDLLCLQLQLALLKATPNYERLRDRVRDSLSQLETKDTLPMVQAQLPLIQAAQTERWWQDATVSQVDELRLAIRGLVPFLDRAQQTTIITDFADDLGTVTEVAVPTQQTGFSPYQYRKKVEAYIRSHADHVAIAKVKRNLPLTETDLTALETLLFNAEATEGRDRFEFVFPGKSLPCFVREIVGLDRAAAKQAFAHYLEGTLYTATQIRFIETIIDYLTQNGTMDPAFLYESPFTDTHPTGVDGVFEDGDVERVIDIVQSFNRSLDVTYSAPA